MSYIQSYSEIIRVSDSETFDYPASESGGSKTVTVYIDVPINIDIVVDTEPFDRSILKAEGHINLLTETVVASETAEVLAINEGAKKISGSIVNGFFSFIKYDISQQISEYRPLVETRLLTLLKLGEDCKAKKNQMTSDFNRISERYVNIFHDLDREANNRIKTLNHEAFNTVNQISKIVTFSGDNSLFNAATVSNLEGSNASSMLFSSGLKIRAYDLIKKARNLLLDDKNLRAKLTAVLGIGNEKKNSLKLLPIIYTEIDNETQKKKPAIKYDTNFQGFNTADFKTVVEQSFKSENFSWMGLSANVINQVEPFLQAEIGAYNKTAEPHKNRVSEKVWQLWNMNKNTLQSNQNYV